MRPSSCFTSRPRTRGLSHPDGHREAPKGPARGTLPQVPAGSSSLPLPPRGSARSCSMNIPAAPGPSRGPCGSAEAPRALASLPKSKCCFVLPEHFVFAHIRKWLPMLSGHTSCFTGDEHGRGSSAQSLARRVRGSPCAPACPTLHFTSIPFSHNPAQLPRPCRNNRLCPVRALLPTKTLRIGRIPKAWGCCRPHLTQG